ncbi:MULTISPECIES: hypothetical protein [Brevibacillus]|uniref:hypothetical protein n=1 Tax=Brevibacillus TaxID=55080 RepID=UPI001606390A|nr:MULTISPECIES: hypothetical protein [Brevibacillus]MDH4619768.1 hypothetical protein [Brevibacillus sp. AY1]
MDSVVDYYTGFGAYFFNLEDIEPFMESIGFETLDLIGSTNIGTLLTADQSHPLWGSLHTCSIWVGKNVENGRAPVLMM